MRLAHDAQISVAAALRTARANQATKQVDRLVVDCVHEVASEHELEGIPYWQQGNTDQYSPEMVAARFELRRHPLVLTALHEWWQTALRSLQSGGDSEACLMSRDQYCLICKRLYGALMPTLDEEDAIACAETEWDTDSKGQPQMERGLFLDAMFELADTWCRTAEADEYATFLSELLTVVATEGPPHARLFWQDPASNGAAQTAAEEALSGWSTETTNVRPRPQSQPTDRATPPKRPRGQSSQRGWRPTGPAKSGTGAPWKAVNGIVSWQRRSSHHEKLPGAALLTLAEHAAHPLPAAERDGPRLRQVWDEVAGIMRWVRIAKDASHPVWRPGGCVNDPAFERMDWGDRAVDAPRSATPAKPGSGGWRTGRTYTADADRAAGGLSTLARGRATSMPSLRPDGDLARTTQRKMIVTAAQRWLRVREWALARRVRILMKWDAVIAHARRRYRQRVFGGKLPPLSQPPPSPVQPVEVAFIEPPAKKSPQPSEIKRPAATEWKAQPMATFSAVHLGAAATPMRGASVMKVSQSVTRLQRLPAGRKAQLHGASHFYQPLRAGPSKGLYASTSSFYQPMSNAAFVYQPMSNSAFVY